MFSVSDSVGPAVQSAVLDCLPTATLVSPGSVNRSLPEGHVLGEAVPESPRILQVKSEDMIEVPSKNPRLAVIGEVKIDDLEEGGQEQKKPTPSTNERQRPSLNIISNRIQNLAVCTIAGTAELAAATLTLALTATASAASAATGQAIMDIHHDGYDVSEGVKAAVTGSLLVGVPSYALGRAIGLCRGSTSEKSFGELCTNSTIEAFGGAFFTSLIGAAFRQNELGVDDDISLGNHCLAGLVGGLIIGAGIKVAFAAMIVAIIISSDGL